MTSDTLREVLLNALRTSAEPIPKPIQGRKHKRPMGQWHDLTKPVLRWKCSTHVCVFDAVLERVDFPRACAATTYHRRILSWRYLRKRAVTLRHGIGHPELHSLDRLHDLGALLMALSNQGRATADVL